MTNDELLKLPVYIPHRPKKDPREIRILDPACGSGHFLLYCFGLLLVIYEEAYDDPDLGSELQVDYATKDDFRRLLPGLILRHNLHGIDIDLRAVQIAVLALWLRCQRYWSEILGPSSLAKDKTQWTRDQGLRTIRKSNVVCAEPMPGEKELLDEFLKTLRDDHLEALIRQVMQVPEATRVRATKAMADSLSDLVRTVWEKMQLAGEAGALLKIEEELQDAIRRGQEEWEERLPLFRYAEYRLGEEPKEQLLRFVPGEVGGEGATFWDKAESLVRQSLDELVSFASAGGRFQRQLFAEDAKQGLGFVDVCRQRFHVVLMNPPFGESSKPARGLLEKQYPRTKNDLYAAFVEMGLRRLHPGGLLGAITSRTGFFLSSFQKWREEILLREAQPTVFADLGYGVLDTAMVETAAY
ncbi:MAG: DNA methyltransferase [Isosphaeraceae bacterium]